jgi:hypothetical protein
VSQRTSKLQRTEQGSDDDEKVEHVPHLAKIMEAESDQFHGTLESEDDNKDIVNVVENVFKRLRHVVVIQSHRAHIQQNYDHNGNVELLTCCQVEEEQLTLELCTTAKKTCTIYIAPSTCKESKI